jgi:hypothetical protein
VCDLRQFLIVHPQLDREQRAGLRFEICWRAATIILLLFYAATMLLYYQKLLPLQDTEEILLSIFGGGTALRETVLVLLMMLIVGSVPFVPRKPRWSWLHAIVNLVACICAIGLCLYLWLDHTSIHHLVHIAANGIDTATPLKYSLINPRQYPRDCSLYFFGSLISSGLVIFNWICLRRFAVEWTASGKCRGFWLGSFLLGIASVSGFLLWFYGVGFKRISPFFAEVGSPQPYHYWVAVGLMFLIIVTALTYRMAVKKYSPTNDAQPHLSWRENPNRYFHEWRTYLVGLAAMDVGFRMYGIIQPYLNQAGGRPMSFWQILAYGYVYLPTGCLWLALVILALSRALARRPRADDLQSGITRLNRVKFVAIWLATAYWAFSSSLMLVWMSFGLWFNPWFGSR